MSPRTSSSHHSWSALMLLVALAIAVAIGVFRMRQIRAEEAWKTSTWDPEMHGVWACAPDSQRFCDGAGEKDPHIEACLTEHAADLSNACREYRDYLNPSDNWQNVCGAELQGYCGGRTQAIVCLKQYRDRLNPRCQSLLEHFEADATWRRACRDDVQRLCPDKPLSASGAGSCLASRRSELSASCQMLMGG